jgi:sensor histidine kinase regulating citrate/malate metabolism
MNLGVTLHKITPFQNFSVAFDRHWMDKITALTVESAIEIAESGSITLGFNGTTEGVEIYCHVEGVCNNTQINQSITDYENSRDINYRSDSAIGIGICKAIADKVNGSFTVENSSNETTEFIINIPCRILDVSAN